MRIRFFSLLTTCLLVASTMGLYADAIGPEAVAIGIGGVILIGALIIGLIIWAFRLLRKRNKDHDDNNQ